MGICGHSEIIYLPSILIQTGKLQVIVTAVPQLVHHKFGPHPHLLRGVPTPDQLLLRLKEMAYELSTQQ